MKQITITFKISSFDFTYIWNQYLKKGGAFNKFLIDYYIEEIAEKFPNAEKVVPKLYLTCGNTVNLTRLLCGYSHQGSPDRPQRCPSLQGLRDADKLRDNFFVGEQRIKNPIEVGI